MRTLRDPELQLRVRGDWLACNTRFSDMASERADDADDDATLAFVWEALEAGAGDPVAAAAELIDAANKSLIEERARRDRFGSEVLDHWGPALDGLDILITTVDAAGDEWDANYGSEVFTEAEYVARALQQLWGGAVTVGYEVLTLLRNGQGAGAIARWRTLHELQVVAHVLARSTNKKIGLLYLEREDLRRARALVDWHRASKEDDRVDRLDRDLVREAQRTVDRFVSEYGAEMGGDFGWAHPLMHAVDQAYRARYERGMRPTGPRFGDLQGLVDLRVFAPDYAMASTAIHASPVLGTGHLPGQLQGLFVGPSVHGLRTAGNNAAQAVADVAAALLCAYPAPPDEEMAAVAKVITALGDRVASMFREADERLRRLHGYDDAAEAS